MSRRLQNQSRREVAAMANERALEEQEMRENPLDHTSGGSGPGVQRFNQMLKGILKGSGATPSAGLSKVRGGKSHAYQQGAELSRKIHEMHGAGFWQDFGDGFKKGFLGVMKPALDIGSVLPGQLGIVSKIGNIGLKTLGLGKPKRKCSKKMESDSESESDKEMEGSGVISDVLRSIGLGKRGMGRRGLPKTGRMSEAEAHAIEDMEGGTGTYDGLGRPRKVRAKRGPLSASDPRRRRAELVKRVMREKGLKMIQASQYVKAHNLQY